MLPMAKYYTMNRSVTNWLTALKALLRAEVNLNPKFMLATIALLLSLNTIAAPTNTKDFTEHQASYISFIPEGSVIQGSAAYGGIQPDYLINFTDVKFKTLRDYLDQIKANTALTFLKKVELTKRAVSSLLKKKSYDELSNSLLALQYKEDGQDIPLSEYAHHSTGVCREHALILHKALNWIGVENHYVYAKISREISDVEITEDHAFNTIHFENQDWIIDSYYRGFDGFLYSDIVAGVGRPRSLPGTPEYKSQRSIIRINNYPLAWLPKRTGLQRSCAQIFKN